MGLLRLLVAALTAATFAHAASAQAIEERFRKVLQTDAPSSSDHPLLGRYAGSFILAQSRKTFDELTLPAGAAQGMSYSEPRWGQTARGEGKLTRTLYVLREDRSSLEVTRNYQDRLASRGFETVFACAGESCGEAFPKLKSQSPEAAIVDKGYDRTRTDLSRAALDYTRDLRYVLMRQRGPEGETLVALSTAVMTGGSNGDNSAALAGTTQTLIEMVEPRAMERNLVTVAAAEIATKVSTEGRVAFYGINFDFDKADVRPDSEPQLAEIAKFLKSGSAKAFIVGHTDGKGGLDYNISLSQRRAEAVVRTLTAKYGIDPKRLTARGLGPLAPLASNRAEDGQAKNRRVELVEQ